MNDIRITLLGNAGVLLRWNNVCVMVDGLHRNTVAPFPGLSERVYEGLLRGEPGLDGIDHLLYTHDHIDHFTAEENLRFLRAHPARTLVLPEALARAHPAVVEEAGRRCGAVWRIPADQPETERLLDEGVRLRAIHTLHAGKEYAEVQHISYLLEFGGRGVLLLADSECDRDRLAERLGRVEVAVINPLFLNRSAGRAIVGELLRPDTLVIYHLPPEGRDSIGFRRMVERDTGRHAETLPPTQVLWDELQSIVV